MWRAAAAAAVGLCILPFSARAADIAAASRVDEVTVFPVGAEVKRVARVRLARGDNSIVVPDLPAQANPASIRIEAKGTGPVMIGAVDSRRIFVPRTDAEAVVSERQRLEVEIERLKDERARLEAAAEAAQAQRSFIKHLTELPTVAAAANGTAPAAQHDWGTIYALIGKGMADAQRAALEVGIKIRDLDRRIEDLQKALALLAPTRQERTEVRVFANAAADLDLDLAVRYQVTGAGWSPHYDARLDVGGRSSAPRLTLVRRASIRQQTGEPWPNAALSLSTARPAAGVAAPDLKPLMVDIASESPRPPAPAPSGRAMQREAAERESKAEPAAPMVTAREAAASVEQAPFQATFIIKDRLTVPETGEPKRVLIEEQAIEPSLIVKAVPRIDPKTYLYAKIVLPRTAPYLAGPVSLFRDRTYVGSGRLPQLVPGEEHEIGFGADDLIRIRHAVLDEKRGETGLITSSRTDQRSFRITIKNMHERPITYMVQDGIPVSVNQDIKVDLTGRTPPTRRDIDDRRGIIAWDDKLNPDEERVIEYGYRITWPTGKSIMFSH